jgi:hypothetical protein
MTLDMLVLKGAIIMEEKLFLETENPNKSVVKKEDITILVGSILLGTLFNIFFYKKSLGLSYPMFIIAFYGVFLWNLRYKISFKFSFGWLLSIPIISLSATYFIFSNQIFAVLNFLIIPILIISQTILITEANHHKWYDTNFIKDIFHGMLKRALGNIPISLVVGLNSLRIRKRQEKLEVLPKILIGLTISIPLLFIIISLLASADRVFKHYIDKITGSFGSININEFIIQVGLVLLVSMIVFSYIWSFTNSNAGIQTHGQRQSSSIKTKTGSLDPIISITILSVINCVYLVFISFQFVYIFGAITHVLPPDFTYADYARRGFFELLTVTLINFTLLLSSLRLTRKDGQFVAKTAQLLHSLLVVCTMVILASAYFRMSLYETAYGYTYLRVLTHSFMMFLGVLFVIAFYKIWNERISLIKPYIVVSIMAFMIINFVNIDVLIAKNNINRYLETGKLDTQYLRCLSYDTIPQLVNLIDDDTVSLDIKKYLREQQGVIIRNSAWQSFNLSRYKAKQVLSRYKF